VPIREGQHVFHLFEAGDIHEVLADQATEASIVQSAVQHEVAKVRPIFSRDAVALAYPLDVSPGHRDF
jgi:hypothetical protein